MKVYILRGVSGSGKSTLAKRLAGNAGRVHSADASFYDGGVYKFDPSRLEENHNLNFQAFCESLRERVPVVVLDNTNSQRWEYERHEIAARENGYEVEIISLPHLDPELAAKRNTHGVPAGIIRRMINRWESDPRETHYTAPEGQGKGTMIINVTPHPINFRAEDGTEFEVPPCGVVVNAAAENEPAGIHPSGVQLVRVRFSANAASSEALDRLERENPGAVIVGSIIAAQGFPGRVVGMIAAEGYERRPPAEKRMRPDRFTVF